jgi:cbb3-type cytochrome c oxidase subunit III
MTAASLRACAWACALAAAGCTNAVDSPPPFRTAVALGGRRVSAVELEHGRESYTPFCRPCHGDAGDGKGLSAEGLVPPPRDLRLGVYKFSAVPAGQLPRDEDLARTIRVGLHGTAMLGWDVPERDLDDLIQFVKAFSPRWRNEAPGDSVLGAPDPWGDREAEALARGTRVYHGLAQCAVACHPAYAARAEIAAYTKELTGNDVTELRADIYRPVAKDSDYGVKIVPPDFTFDELRGGDSTADIYRAVAAGIGGTAMPTWKNVLPEADLWAVAHYVRSLVAMRDRSESIELARRLRDQPPWTPTTRSPPVPAAP